MTRLAIETRGLMKSFGGRVVVDGVDLLVPEGSVFGFLGPNGSGKTTTVRMLLGLAFPIAGTVKILGQEIPKHSQTVLRQVGALVESPAFYPFLSGRQNLERYENIGRSRIHDEAAADVEEALSVVGLTQAANKRYRAYSLGMKQRLAIAHALVRPRRLLILDEPTNGLDPQGTREVRNIIRRLHEKGTTIFLSSHLLSEIDQLCTHAAVINNGRILKQGPMDSLRSKRKSLLRIHTPDLPAAQEVLNRMEGTVIASVEQPIDGDGIIDIELANAMPEQVASALVHAHVRLRGMSETQPSLEDTFVALTGEGFDVSE